MYFAMVGMGLLMEPGEACSVPWARTARFGGLVRRDAREVRDHAIDAAKGMHGNRRAMRPGGGTDT